MSYEVLARKWRPKQFDDVIGQGHVTQTLKNAILSNRVAHAYLFVGPRGVGKTSIARIFSKALNCEKGPTPTPCGQCDSCQEIVNGNNLDVLEIDAASNTGVDNVRDLRDNARYAPVRGKFKVYIIDEVHMLSIGAFNALLKILEEPPGHVKFILATTDPQKVPATILSRCQRFDLRRISTREIVAQLRNISTAEQIEIDDDALLAIARGAEGGLRDAESALDQLTAFRGKHIEEADVLSVFGLVARKTLEDLADATLKGDVGRLMHQLAELDNSGKDLQRLSIELIEYFRNLLVMMYAGPVTTDQDLTDAQIASLKNQMSGIDPARVARLVDILIDVQGQLRYSLSRRTVLEIALIRSARTAVTVSIDEILAKLNQLKSAMGSNPDAALVTGAPNIVQEKPAVKYGSPPATSAPAAAPAATPTAAPAPVDSRDELAMLTAEWHDLIEQIGHLSILARNYLRDARPVAVNASRVTIGFDPEFASNMGKIEVPRNVSAIQNVLGEALNRQVAVSFCILDPGQVRQTLPKPDQAKTQTDANTTIGKGDAAGKPVTAKGRQRWINDPAVKRALETFNGDIVDIRE